MSPTIYVPELEMLYLLSLMGVVSTKDLLDLCIPASESRSRRVSKNKQENISRLSKRYAIMYISDDDIQNYPFCRLKLLVETFERST